MGSGVPGCNSLNSQALNELLSSLGFVCPPHVLSLSGFTGPALAPLPSLPDESPLRGEFYRSLFIAAGWGSVS